jgi:predicted  nucleic acid-binding Zn-ribbon protein
MDTENKKIADMVRDMHFERKKPPTKRMKTAYTAIKTELDDIARDLGALRLALWHAEHQRDYHQLSPDDIKARLNRTAARIETLSAHHLSDPAL